MRPETIPQNLRCPLTDQEKIRFGEALARLLEEMGEVEDEQKATASQFKAQLEGIEKAVTKSRKIITAGYEYRWIDCKVLYNDPASRQKTLVRLDTGEVVRVEDMSEDECQENLPLKAEPAPAKESLLPLQMGEVSRDAEPRREAKGPNLQSAMPGNDEQLRGGISGRVQSGDQPERAPEVSPVVEPSIQESAKETIEHGSNGIRKPRKGKTTRDPQTQQAGYPA